MSAVTVLVTTALLLAAPSSINSASKNRPAGDYFNLCRMNDPKLNECIKKNIIDLRETLVKGIPELKLVPLDPMNIPRMQLTEGAANFRFQQTLTNLTIYGLGKYNVEGVDYKKDGSSLVIRVAMKTPTLKMTADYVMDGQILVLPIRGDGDCELNFSDVSTVATVRGNAVQRGGKEYIEVDDVEWDINVGGARSQFNNLFNGDRLLGDTTNNFLNANWKDAFETYKHLPEQAFGVVFKDLVNRVYKRYPINELFL